MQEHVNHEVGVLMVFLVPVTMTYYVCYMAGIALYYVAIGLFWVGLALLVGLWWVLKWVGIGLSLAVVCLVALMFRSASWATPRIWRGVVWIMHMIKSGARVAAKSA